MTRAMQLCGHEAQIVQYRGVRDRTHAMTGVNRKTQNIRTSSNKNITTWAKKNTGRVQFESLVNPSEFKKRLGCQSGLRRGRVLSLGATSMLGAAIIGITPGAILGAIIGVDPGATSGLIMSSAIMSGAIIRIAPGDTSVPGAMSGAIIGVASEAMLGAIIGVASGTMSGARFRASGRSFIDH